MSPPLCFQSLSFEIAELMSSYPPVWRHSHKQAIYERVKRDAGLPVGRLHYSRWAASELSGEVKLFSCEVVAEPDFYTYPESQNAVWHVNFADPRLFAAYGSALLAQDELQALEHPVLGSLREALLDGEHPALTRENGRATPVLVAGVPRQCALDTHPRRRKGMAGRSLWSRLFGRTGEDALEGLYGNHFQRARLEDVMAALIILTPPTLTNLIAIAAPTGKGRYTRRQIMDVLETAVGGMRAAAAESKLALPDISVEVHTGWWGCGAFGGNRSLMVMLQALAAMVAGIGRLVFHTGSQAEGFEFEEGKALLETLVAETDGDMTRLVDAIENLGFTWGMSDGN